VQAPLAGSFAEGRTGVLAGRSGTAAPGRFRAGYFRPQRMTGPGSDGPPDSGGRAFPRLAQPGPVDSPLGRKVRGKGRREAGSQMGRGAARKGDEWVLTTPNSPPDPRARGVGGPFRRTAGWTRIFTGWLGVEVFVSVFCVIFFCSWTGVRRPRQSGRPFCRGRARTAGALPARRTLQAGLSATAGGPVQKTSPNEIVSPNNGYASLRAQPKS